MKKVTWSVQLIETKPIPRRPVRYMVEYATSDRAICQTCKQVINMDDLRIGKMTQTPKYYHVDHFKDKVIEAWGLDGYEKLRKVDQRIVTAAFAT
jgi:hypothetical protein